MKPIILPFRGIYPTIHETAFIAPGAVVIGDVHIGAGSSIWYGCVVRGDVHHIRIGENTNIQDSTVIHVSREEGPTFIGSHVTVGHKAVLHACILGDYSFVGMGAVVMDFAEVESKAMVAAGTLVTPGKKVFSGQIWAGSPAHYLRDLSEEEREYIPVSASNYVTLAKEHQALTL
ncbi:MAG: gamma carbonic anhydrase family protein [Alphaproteobacteria bacterium]|nr:gamma carbonic anhydrase family protein [Alphaproteobacteria bacterium]